MGEITIKPRKPFFKYCKTCGNKFHPTGKFQKLCDDCLAGIKHKLVRNKDKISLTTFKQ